MEENIENIYIYLRPCGREEFQTKIQKNESQKQEINRLTILKSRASIHFSE